MELKLNREYALRHLGVAALFLGLAGWFAWDAAVVYPQMDDAALAAQIHREALRPGDRAAAVGRQWQFAALSLLASLVIALRVGRAASRTLAWDAREMNGTLTGGRPLAFDAVAAVDRARWAKKGILVVTARDGRRFTLDAWHHQGVTEIERRFADASL